MATYAGMFGSGDWATPDNRPKHWIEQAFELPVRFLPDTLFDVLSDQVHAQESKGRVFPRH